MIPDTRLRQIHQFRLDRIAGDPADGDIFS